MASSSILRYSLLIMALVGVLALGVNSCAAPEETKTEAAATASSTDGDSSDNGTTTSDDASLTALIWDQGSWGTHKWQ